MKNKSKYIGLTKGVLTVTSISRATVNNKHTVVQCVCSKCGKTSEVYLDHLTMKAPYAEHYCKHCRTDYILEQAKQKYIGKKNGVLECVDVIKSDTKKSKNGYRTMAVCKCSVCGAITEIRADRLLDTSKYTPQSCSNCVKDLYRQTTKERYYKLYGCSGEEYEIKRYDSERIQKFKTGAETRNLDFQLSNEEAKILLHESCYYCGKPHADGIDRIDSNKGYIKENCVPCCRICNIMKNKFSTEVFFSHVKSIYEKHFINEGSTTIPQGSTSQANGDGKRRDPNE